MDCVHPCRLRADAVVQPVVDEHAPLWRYICTVAQKGVNFRRGFDDANLTRHDCRAEDLQQFGMRFAAFGPCLRRPIGDRMDGRAGIFQGL